MFLFAGQKERTMKKSLLILSLLISVCRPLLLQAAPPEPEAPAESTVEALVNKYVDQEFISEELPPPEQCNQYSEKLMFAYDWSVAIRNIGPYDSTRKLWPVEAVITVRCGPFQSQPQSGGADAASAFPLKAETPIDFLLSVDAAQAQQWIIQEVTLWKSKQKVTIQ